MKITCRICEKKLSKKILSLKDMPLTDDLIEADKQNRKEYIKDINIYSCDHCGTVQNPDDFDHHAHYRDYQYSSGYSDFTKNFMKEYAKETLEAFKRVNGRVAESALEIGSGDGQQLMQYKSFGIENLMGVEPSEYLTKIARENEIETENVLFGTETLNRFDKNYDICLSSYTLDHVRQPIDYFTASYQLLVDGGILALEVHDLNKIVDRTEFCLFEHEHTIYMSPSDICYLLEQSGFSIISVNPLSSKIVRGNSMIVIAQKNMKPDYNFVRKIRQPYLENLQNRVFSTIEKIDNWIDSLPSSARLTGFGAGGRGVMTIAALSKHERIEALFDSNYESEKYLTPKTRVPIVGQNEWHNYKDTYCIIFSFGYYNEIVQNLISKGFDKKKIISLLDFYTNNNDSLS